MDRLFAAAAAAATVWTAMLAWLARSLTPFDDAGEADDDMTVRHFLRSTQTNAGTGIGPPAIYDLLLAAGSGTGVTGDNTQDTAFDGNTDFGFQRTVGAETMDSTTWPFSVNVTAFLGDVSFRFRLQRVNSSGTVQSSSPYSTTYTTTGVKTGNITWSSGTWSAGDRLRLAFEHFRTSGHGNVNLTVGTSTASWIDAPYTAATTFDEDVTVNVAATVTAEDSQFPSTPAALTNDVNDAAQTSYATESLTPTSDADVWLAVALRRADPNEPVTPTVTGCGLTWSAVDEIYYDAATTRGKLFLFRGTDPSPTTGAITMDLSGVTHEGAVWAVWEHEQLAATPVVQTGTASNESSASIAVSLPAAATAGNGIFGVCVSYDTAGGPFNPQTGWGEIVEAGPLAGEGNLGVNVAWRDNIADETPSWDLSSAASNNGAIAVEIAPLAAAGGGTEDVTVTVAATVTVDDDLAFGEDVTVTVAATVNADPIIWRPFHENFDAAVADGTAVTIGNTTFTRVDQGEGTPTGTLEFDTAQSVTGGASGLFISTTADNSQAYGVFFLDEASVQWLRFYMRPAANPDGTVTIVQMKGPGGSPVAGGGPTENPLGDDGVLACQLRMSTGRALQMRDETATNVGTATNAIPLNDWTRVEMMADPTSDTLELRTYEAGNLHGTTPTQTRQYTSWTHTPGSWYYAQVGWISFQDGGNGHFDELATSGADWVGAATVGSTFNEDVQVDVAATVTVVDSVVRGEDVTATAAATVTVDDVADYIDTVDVTVAAAIAVDDAVAGAGDIPHTYVEGGHRIGPIADANGNLYIFAEVDEASGQPFMLKSSDGGDTWAEVDQAGRPAQTDMEGTDIRLVGDVLHIGLQGPGSDDVRYVTFHASTHPTTPDTWQINELVTSGPDPLEQTACLEVRGDGTVVIGYGRGVGQTTGHVCYKIRSAGGSWGTEVVIDSADQTNTYYQITSVIDSADLVHFLYGKSNGDLLHRTLSTGDVLGASQVVTSNIGGSSTNDRCPILPPRHHVDGGDEVVTVAYKRVTDDFIGLRTITNAGAPSAETAVSDHAVAHNVVGMNSRMPVATLVRDDAAGEYHVLYANAGGDANAADATRTVYRKYTDGGTWQTAVVFLNGGIDSHMMRAEIFTHSAGNGGNRAIGLYWDTGSAGLEGSRYDEFVLPPAGATFDEDVTVAVAATVSAVDAASSVDDVQVDVVVSVAVDDAVDSTEDVQVDVAATVTITDSADATEDVQVDVAATVTTVDEVDSTEDAQFDVAATVTTVDEVDSTEDAQFDVAATATVTDSADLTEDVQTLVTATVSVDDELAGSFDETVDITATATVTADDAVASTETGDIAATATVTVDDTAQLAEDVQLAAAATVTIAAPASLFVPLAVTTVDGAANYSHAQPGDTLILESGIRSPLTITNLSGTSADWVTVTDDGSLVDIQGAGEYAGIRIRGGSQYVRIVGSSSQVGAQPWRDNLAQIPRIKISGCQRGLSPWAGGGTEAPAEHIECAYIEVADTTQNPGIHTSNSAIGDLPLQRDLWFHDCWVHDAVGEGFYIGASTWTTTPAATEIDGVAIDDCLITDCGWDGIQVGSASYDSERENRIVGNVCLSNGHAVDAAGTHTKNIVVNDGCIRMRIDGNWVDDAAEEGIYDQGMGGGIAARGNAGGNGLIVNNVVLRSGGTSAETGDGIVLGNGHGDTGGVIVAHNTIIGPTPAEGVGVDNNRDVGTHEIRNNIILNHSTAIATNGNETVSNNRTTGTVADVQFVDAPNDNYHLSPTSPAVGAGIDLSAFITTDYDGVSRPQDGTWDQGAFELLAGAVVYNEDATVLVAGAVTVADDAALDEDVEVAATATIQATDTATVNDTVDVVAAATIQVSDAVTASDTEDVTVTAAATATVDDTAQFVDDVTTTVAATATVDDAVDANEDVTVAAAATITVDDDLTNTANEDVTVTAAATITVEDTVDAADLLDIVAATTFDAVVDQLMVDISDMLAQATVTVTDSFIVEGALRDTATWIDTTRPHRWTAEQRPHRWTATPRPDQWTDTTRRYRWTSTTRPQQWTDESARPHRWSGTIRPTRWVETVFLREGDSNMAVALNFVDLGDYTQGEIPEPLLIRVMEPPRDPAGAPRAMQLFNQTPAWTATVTITGPGAVPVATDRVVEIVDPADMVADYPNDVTAAVDDEGWLRLAWVDGDLDIVTLVSGNDQDYEVQVRLDNGTLRLKSTDIWRPKVRDGVPLAAVGA